jgi:multicomponent Na+:H+ antiporter subunit E
VSPPRSAAGPAIARGASLFALWMVLMQSVDPLDLAVGAVATAFATMASLRLLPPGAGRIRFLALLAQVPRFLWQSLLAGVDVAWRALAPGATLRTGFVDYRTGFPRGQSRNLFATITSLMPGTLPTGDGAETIEFHCLDVEAPVLEQMADEERRLAKALVPGEPHA